jgi:hypothetical protein
VPLLCREQLRWLSAALAVQVHAMGLHSRSSEIDPEDPFLPEELWDFAAIRAAAAKGKGDGPTHSHWSRKVKWDVDVLKTLPAGFVERRRQLVLDELRWWADESPAWNGKWVRGHRPDPTWRYQSDASGYGSGLTMLDTASGELEDVGAQFHWRGAECSQSINFKELATPELCLDAIDKHEQQRVTLRGGVLHGKLDNTSAVSYINKQGGPTVKLSLLAEKFWRWCLQRGLWTTAEHLAGVLNVVADRKSRARGDRSEYRLTEETWGEVERLFGPHSVDLFASRTNALLERHFTWHNSEGSAGTNAFKQDWSLEDNCFAHPPFSLLPRLLEQVKRHRVTITVVAPVWLAQPWLSTLINMAVEPPQLLLAQPLLQEMLPSRWQPSQPTWSTAVWRISGDASALRARQPLQWRNLWAA